MTLLLPSDLPFGTLRLLETWLEYDGPKLFVAVNRSGQRFLFNAVDEDEESISYLAVAISDERSAMLRSGGLALREAFTSPQDRFVFGLRADYSSQTVSAQVLSPNELTDDLLPTPAALIRRPTDTLPAFEPDDLAVRAIAEGRTLLAVRLRPPTLLRSEYPARPLSDALRVVQSLAEALVQEESGTTTARGPLSNEVIEDAELAVLDLQAASFVAILAPSRTARSVAGKPSIGLEMPRTAAALGKLQSLLAACSEPDQLRTDIQDLGVRAVTKVRDLLEVALDQNTSLTTYLAVPNEPVQVVELSTAQASEGVLVLSERDEQLETITLDAATLVGVNLRTWVFELNDESHDPPRFSGKVQEQARSQIQGLPTGDAYRYRAEILAQTFFSELTDEKKTKHSLKAIERATDLAPGTTPTPANVDPENPRG